jgi:hypothetical protein
LRSALPLIGCAFYCVELAAGATCIDHDGAGGTHHFGRDRNRRRACERDIVDAD